MDDKRKSPRISLELAAAFQVPEEGDHYFNATILNISLGGFCFFTYDPIKKGTPLKLIVDLPENENVTLNVGVVWCRFDEVENRYYVGVCMDKDSQLESFNKFEAYYTDEQLRLNAVEY